jgi:hypothetical protein
MPDFRRPRTWNAYKFLRSLGWTRLKAVRWILTHPSKLVNAIGRGHR